MNFEIVLVDEFDGCVEFAAITEGKHVSMHENTTSPRQLLPLPVALWGAVLCGPLGIVLGMLPILWSSSDETKPKNTQAMVSDSDLSRADHAHLESERDSTSTGSTPRSELPTTSTAANTSQQLQQYSSIVQSADTDLKDGRFIQALSRYRSASEMMRPTPHVLLRQALAAEASGDDPLAWESFLQASELDSLGRIGRVAQLGMARISTRLGNVNHAIHCLSRLILLQPCEEDPAILEESVHLLAHLRCGGVSNDRVEWKDLQRLALPALKLTPDRWSQYAEDDTQEAHSAQSISRVERKPGITVQPNMDGKHPDQVWITAAIPDQDVHLSIEAVCLCMGWKLQLDAESRPLIEGRVVGLDFDRLTIGYFLDLVLHDTHLKWSYENRTIFIRPQTESVISNDVQSRACRVALAVAPRHPWSGSTLLAMAKLAMSADDPIEATRWLEQALRVFPRSDLSSVLYFNLGKARLAMNQIKAAQLAFQRSVDSGHSQPCLAPAYLFLGRLQLEQSELRSASTSLSRCLAIGPHWPEAAHLLAVAQLRSEHPVNANTILMDHRALFVEPHDRDIAAFLSACARYRHATTEPSKDLEAREIVRTMGPMTQTRSFSTALPMLVADISRELGLENAAIEIAREILDVEYDHACREQAGLLVCELTDDRDELAAETGSELWRLRAWLRHGVNGLDRRNPQLVVSRCQRLLSNELPLHEREQCLRTLGSAYESMGQHLEAVYCFAGVPPELAQDNARTHE